MSWLGERKHATTTAPHDSVRNIAACFQDWLGLDRTFSRLYIIHSPWLAVSSLQNGSRGCQVKVKVKVGKSLHRLNFPVLTSSFRPLFDLPDAPSAVPPTGCQAAENRQTDRRRNAHKCSLPRSALPAGGLNRILLATLLGTSHH